MRKTFALVAAMMLTLASCRLLAKSQEIDLVPYSNGNIQANLFPTFPTGHVIPPKNAFGEPFYIPAADKNFVVLEKEANPLTLPVGVLGVRKVFTLMQALGPWPRAPICVVQFIGSNGASQTFPLIGGQNIRDFFESNFARTINGNTTQTAFEFIGRGGAYTSDTTNGPRGFYNFDEQEFDLGPAFANETLESIKFTAMGQGGTPILLGVTVETSPEPKIQIFSANNLYYGGLIGGLIILVGAAIFLRIRKR